MVSEHKLAKNLLKNLKVLYELNTTVGDSPVYTFLTNTYE